MTAHVNHHLPLDGGAAASFTSPVLVLGGGINGSAIAREFAYRGVEVCLVDSADFGGGTSAASSRLVHGGVRYLEYGEFKLVREALRERSILLKEAPDLVAPLQLWIPGSSWLSGCLQSVGRLLWRREPRNKRPRGWLPVRLGLAVYDRLARTPRHQKARTHWLPGAKRNASHDGPELDPATFRWAIRYLDGQVAFPERWVISQLRDAKLHAQETGLAFGVYNYTQASLDAHGSVELRSTVAGPDHPITIRPRLIINATGAWVDETLKSLDVPSTRLIGGTKGSHLFLDHAELRQRLAGQAVYVEARDGRPVFVLPFGQFTLLGTTDLRTEESPGQVRMSPSEQEYLLAALNLVFPNLGIEPGHIRMHCCGVRPLPFRDEGSPSATTRSHQIVARQGEPPIWSVVGGKLTTCRALAEDVVEQYRQEFSDLGGPSKVSPTRSAPLRDPVGREARDQLHATSEGRVEDFRSWVVRTTREAITHEWATCLGDIIERRNMLLFHPQLSLDALDWIADLLVECGWMRPEVKQRTVESYLESLQEKYGLRLEAPGS